MDDLPTKSETVDVKYLLYLVFRISIDLNLLTTVQNGKSYVLLAMSYNHLKIKTDEFGSNRSSIFDVEVGSDGLNSMGLTFGANFCTIMK